MKALMIIGIIVLSITQVRFIISSVLAFKLKIPLWIKLENVAEVIISTIVFVFLIIAYFK